MRAAACIQCGKILSIDEIALNQRLLGMQIGCFHCIRCLAEKLDTSADRLQTLTVRFKEMGCVYFTRLMEEIPDEKENDGL